MNKKKIVKIFTVLSLIAGLQINYMPQAEAGFLGGIIFFPIKTAKKVVQTTGETAIRTGGTVVTKAGKKVGKTAIKEASPAKQIKRSKKAIKRAKKAGKVGYRIYGGFAK